MILVIFAGLLIFFAASLYITHTNNLNFAKDTVMKTAQIYADLYDSDTDIFSSFVKESGDTRITIISADGTVLTDSRPLDVNSLENHLDRPEIQAALNGTPKAYVRHSESLGLDFVYYALQVKSEGGYVFIRTAVAIAEIDAYFFRSLPPLVLTLFAVAVLCLVLVGSIIKRITQPFNAIEAKLQLLQGGSYTSAPTGGSYEEVDEIMRNIDELAVVLQDNLHFLSEEKNKLNYILDNIADGLFAVDENKNIALINNTALDIFNVTPGIIDKNLNYLSYDKTLGDAIEDCVNNSKNALFELTLNGSIYLITVKRVPDAKLTMAMLTNVTESRENAKRREEFFANASHELKTPLTAIKGFNELTAIGNKDESLNKFIEGISRETDRMLSLIGDMLKLSELENMQKINPVPVSLAKIIGEVGESVSAAISEKAVIFETSGDAVVEAEPEHIYELLKNLVENAVRYNNQGGRVSVTVKSDKAVQLTVSDNGIGISPEEQTRIFERFYRAEKSRSQKSGGTGLGLSIVKHICALYGWNLSLKSKLGIGTEVTVVF